jgi:hypothetical protein
MTESTPILRITTEEAERLIDFNLPYRKQGLKGARAAAIAAAATLTLIVSWALVGISV